MGRDVEVLILTSDLDFATDRICRELDQQNIPFLRLNRENLPEIALTLDPVGGSLFCRHQDREWHVGDRLRAIWWRQATFDRETGGVVRSLPDQLERSQWGAFMRAMMVFDRAHWINHPAAVYRAESKPVQLSVAAGLGFAVPSTLMTNDSTAQVEEIIGTRIAIKSIDTLLLRDGEDQLFGYTQITNWDDVATADLRRAPVTAQTAIEPKTDLRVTVVGDWICCVAIRRHNAGIDGDWRLTPKHDIEIDDFELPVEIEIRCLDLVRKLGLRFGAIDLALADDRYWFIEINPTGEWGWLDNAERRISAAIVGELMCPA